MKKTKGILMNDRDWLLSKIAHFTEDEYYNFSERVSIRSECNPDIEDCRNEAFKSVFGGNKKCIE